MPVENAGAAAICKLERRVVSAPATDSRRMLTTPQINDKTEVSFLFQKRRFTYDPEKGSFGTLSYTIDSDPPPRIGHFQKTQGLATQREIDGTQEHYGDNTYDIPVPTFTELWKEHAVAPLFVFQIFCVGLWLLDE